MTIFNDIFYTKKLHCLRFDFNAKFTVGKWQRFELYGKSSLGYGMVMASRAIIRNRGNYEEIPKNVRSLETTIDYFGKEDKILVFSKLNNRTAMELAIGLALCNNTYLEAGYCQDLGNIIPAANAKQHVLYFSFGFNIKP